MTDEEKAAAAAEAARLEAVATAAAEAERLARAAADDNDKNKTKKTEAEAEIVQLRADLAKAKADAAKFKGIDPEKAKADAAKVTAAEAATLAAEKAKATAEGNFERLREIQSQEHEAAITAANTAREEADARAAKADERLATAQTKGAFASSRFFIDETILTASKAERLYGDHVEIEDGEVVVYDKPAGAAKRVKIMDSRGNPLSFDEAIKKVVDADPDKDSLMRSRMKAGAGSKTEEGKVVVGKDRLSRLSAGLAALQKK